MVRTLDTYFGPGAYTVLSEVSFVNLTLGFGPPLLRQVWRVIPVDPGQLSHNHIVYDWHSTRRGETLVNSFPRPETHSVLPAILADSSDLRDDLDKHMSKLVNEEHFFRQFPLFNSSLEILKHVYVLYRNLNDVCTSTTIHIEN